MAPSRRRVLTSFVGVGLLLMTLWGLLAPEQSGSQLQLRRHGRILSTLAPQDTAAALRPAVADLPCDAVSDFNSSFTSPLTAGLDGRFWCLAKRVGTDKVAGHHYQLIYSKYLAHAHRQPLRMLEIGLGCDMAYGPGRSLRLWRELLPRAQISFLEYNASCAQDFRPTLELAGGRLYVGSQADPELLQKVVEDAKSVGEGLDLVVDDGGHHPEHQLASLQGLWPALKSGGVYVVEDVMTQYFTHFESTNLTSPFMAWAKRMIDIVHCGSPSNFAYGPKSMEICKGATEMELQVVSIECMVDACVLVKRV